MIRIPLTFYGISTNQKFKFKMSTNSTKMSQPQKDSVSFSGGKSELPVFVRAEFGVLKMYAEQGKLLPITENMREKVRSAYEYIGVPKDFTEEWLGIRGDTSKEFSKNALELFEKYGL
ncbi:MAG: hypothetical protein PHC34_09210 [Candidatus Gastranaerophilales bacterium]|nr:hypothetical protein [Candidatus Gastranaerophilales bacterium]